MQNYFIELNKKRGIFSLLLTLVLILILLISVYRFANYVIGFGRESLQLDFAAYFTAGESLNYGLSPYKNFVSHQPPIWDGYNRYKYSRFLYPPLVASLFQPIAMFPYSTAKFIWIIFELASLILTTIIIQKRFPLPSLNHVLMVYIFALWYFPLLAHMERGQIDLLTLLLITIAVDNLIMRKKNKDLLAGGFLAFAALLKLYIIFFIPFVLLRKRFSVFQGFIYGVVLIIMLTVVVQGGTSHLFDYVYNHIPRMANIGDVGKSDTLVDKKSIRSVLDQTPDGFDTIMDGKGYLLSPLGFTSNATLVEPLGIFLNKRNLHLSSAILSLILFGLFFVFLWLWGRRFYDEPSGADEYLYWQIPLVVTLLVSPITWIMNTVWLLPLFVISLSLLSTPLSTNQKLSVYLVLSGLIVAMLPEGVIFPPLSFMISFLGGQKYLYAEIFVLTGLVSFVTKTPLAK